MEWYVLFFGTCALLSHKNWFPTQMAIPRDRQARSASCSSKHGTIDYTAVNRANRLRLTNLSHVPRYESAVALSSSRLLSVLKLQHTLHFSACRNENHVRIRSRRCREQATAIPYQNVFKPSVVYYSLYRRCVIKLSRENSTLHVTIWER
jgi:hypothetical protein